MRKPTICVCENKDADQLRGNREADQRLCFRHRESTIPLLSKSKIFSHILCLLSSVSNLFGNHIVVFSYDHDVALTLPQALVEDVRFKNLLFS